MGEYNNQLIAAGVMLDGAGLQASAKGARVSLRHGTRPWSPTGASPRPRT